MLSTMADINRLDALFEGDCFDIVEATMADQPDLTHHGMRGPSVFWRRTIIQKMVGTPMEQRTRDHLQTLSENLHIGFSSSVRHGMVVGGFHKPGLSQDGLMEWRSSHIYLCYWQLEPLLTVKMTDSERLVQTFACAKTVSFLRW